MASDRSEGKRRLEMAARGECPDEWCDQCFGDGVASSPHRRQGVWCWNEPKGYDRGADGCTICWGSGLRRTENARGYVPMYKGYVR